MASLGRSALTIVAVAAALLGIPDATTEARLSPGLQPPFDLTAPLQPPDDIPAPAVEWRKSRAIGQPWAGRLRNGVQLPYDGEDYFTWDPILHRPVNRGWRRWGTDRLIAVILDVAEEYRRENPGAPRIGIGDLSRPHGGEFGTRFGGLGHRSHQNGLDVDLFYPRRDGTERETTSPRQIDRRLAQDLVNRFVAHGAQRVYVGPRTGLRGRRGVVSELIHHDDHVHVRIR